MSAANTWYAYRDAWGTHPWVLAVGLLAAALVLAGIVGTVVGGPLAFVFIPGLAVLYVHHLLVQKALD